MELDLANITFIGIASIGAVNVLTFFKPNLDSRYKFAFGVIFAFLLTYVPLTLQADLLERIKTAIAVAFAGSGAYKLADKAGGN